MPVHTRQTTAPGLPPSQVVGWPPIRVYRMNNLMNHSKDNLDGNNRGDGRHEKVTGQSAKVYNNGAKEDAGVKEHEKRLVGGSLFVKVKMDGKLIGRKVDLSAHRTYETLVLALEDIFQKPSSINNLIRSAKTLKLLDGSSEFVLTYEDKDGDWLLAGDVPWGRRDLWQWWHWASWDAARGTCYLSIMGIPVQALFSNQ